MGALPLASLPLAMTAPRCKRSTVGWPALLLAMLWAWWPLPGVAGSQPVVLFDRIGDEERIPDGVITALAQDGRGFLWIGTPEALIRHDGHRFRRYVHDEADARTVPGNRVVALLAARDGRLWVGIQGAGVAVYDPDADRFTRVAVDEAVGLPGLAGQVRVLAETPDRAIWIGTTGSGLVRLDPSGRTVLYRHEASRGALPDDRVAALAVDRNGTLWVGTWLGLARWRGESEGFEPVLSEPDDPDGFAGTTVRGIHPARNGHLWVGAQQGQVAMIPADQLGLDRVPERTAVRRWRANGFFAAAEPADGRVWLGHAIGIDVFPADGVGQPEAIRHQPSDPLSLANAEVRGLHVDRTGLVWVGTFGGGLQRANPANQALQSRRHDPDTDAPLAHLNAVVLAEASDGGAWAGVAQQGVARFDRALRVTEFIPSGGAADQLPGRLPSGIAETADGSLWVATEVGVHVRRSGSRMIETLSGREFTEGAAARRLVPRPDGTLWVATSDGLFSIDRERRVRRHAMRDGRRVGGVFNAVATLPGGDGWAGGTEGLFRISADGALEPLSLEVGGQQLRATVQGILVDRAGVLWIDADGLLRVRSIADGRVDAEPISRRHGYAGVAFGANLLEDAAGRIWTHRFVYDPARDLLLRLGRADGVQIGTGWFRAYARLGDGRFAFGATEGILVVDPDRFVPEPEEQPLAFTELRVDGRVRPIGARPKVLEIAPDERNFTLEFAALDFRAPESRRYRYRLDGIDRDWLEVDAATRFASYGGLWPGHYRLKVQSSRRVGGWGSDVLTLDVRIQPRWWQTTGGLLLLLGGFVGLLMLLAWRRERRLLGEKLRLEREVEGRTVELRALSTELARRNVDLRTASLSDPLTGLRNRRFVMQELSVEIRRLLQLRETDADRSPGMVLFLVDIDGFKSVNDRYGHAAGDALIRQFADRLRAVFRDSDEIVRWGGEEFLIVAQGLVATDAASLAERIRERVGEQPFVLDDGTAVSRTCCIGFAPIPFEEARPRAHGWETVVDVADRALLAAKRLGRNAWIGIWPAPGVRLDGSVGEWLVARRVAGGELVIVASSGIDPAAAAVAIAESARPETPGAGVARDGT
jgi:diguanylate cyclase (GGDEF)-like protein